MSARLLGRSSDKKLANGSPSSGVSASCSPGHLETTGDLVTFLAYATVHVSSAFAAWSCCDKTYGPSCHLSDLVQQRVRTRTSSLDPAE